jgi:hypothetical protein
MKPRSEQERLKTIWNRILSLPIGTRVKYVKKKCRCQACSLSRFVGQIGVIASTVDIEREKQLRTEVYSDVQKGETFYNVQFEGEPYPFSLRLSELKVIWRLPE